MNFRVLTVSMFLIIAMPKIALSGNKKCTDLQNVVRAETINGKSNINPELIVKTNKSRVYFYTAPDDSCIQEDKFVIAGDFLYAYKRHNDFIYVNYFNSKGVIANGWIKNIDINKFNPVGVNAYKSEINITDFIVLDNGNWFGLGTVLSKNSGLLKKTETSSEYIGDFPNESGGLNKFYSHSFNDLNIISSNLNYSARLWTIDDEYIISNIILTSPNYKTIRNIKVGDKKESILKSYSGNNYEELSGNIVYRFGQMSLTFNLQDNKITSIEMSSIPE